MDAIYVIMMALYFTISVKQEKTKYVNAPIGKNSTLYRDEDAFMELFKAIMKK